MQAVGLNISVQHCFAADSAYGLSNVIKWLHPGSMLLSTYTLDAPLCSYGSWGKSGSVSAFQCLNQLLIQKVMAPSIEQTIQ